MGSEIDRYFVPGRQLHCAEPTLGATMRSQGLFIAEAATVSQDGKFYAIGAGVDRIAGPAFPLMQPALAVVLRLVLEPGEIGRHRVFGVHFQGPEPVNPSGVEQQFPLVAHEPALGIPPYLTLVCNFIGLKFERPGLYWAVADVDGVEVDRAALAVQLLKIPAEPRLKEERRA